MLGSRRSRPLSLPARLGIRIGAAIVACVVVFALGVGVLASRTLLEREGARELADARTLAGRIDEDLVERRRDVELIAAMLTPDDLSAAAAPARRTAISRALEDSLAAPTSMTWLGVLDAEGVLRYSTAGHTVGTTLGLTSWFPAGLGGSVIRPEPHEHADNAGPVRSVDVAATVVDEQLRPVGAVVAHLPMDWIAGRRDEVLELTGVEDEQLLVLDAQGRSLLAITDPAAGTGGLAPAPPGTQVDLGVATRVRGQDGGGVVTAIHERADGPDLLVARFAQTRPGLPGWEVVSVRPAVAVTAGARAVGIQLAVFGVLLGALTAGLAVLSVLRASRGLVALDRAARAIRAGEPGAELPLVEGRDDISRASRSLRELTDHLVEQRLALEVTEAQLRAALEIQDEFVAMASHEMRTPLTVVSGAVGLLTAHGAALTEEQRRDLLSATARQLARLERLSSNLLLTQRLADGSPDATPHTPAELFRPATVLGELAGEDVLVGGDPALLVEGSRTLLELVVGNLLENAARYGQPPIEVTYHSSHRGAGAELVVVVTDHGDGVPPEFEPELFGRFAQASRGLQRHAGGTGLGLWLSRQLLSAAGGSIGYTRPAAGGSAFTVLLPIRSVAVDGSQEMVTASGDPG